MPALDFSQLVANYATTASFGVACVGCLIQVLTYLSGLSSGPDKKSGVFFSHNQGLC